MLAGQLEKADPPAISAPNVIVIPFKATYNRQYAACSEASRLQRISDALNRVTSESWTVKCELVAGEPAIAEDARRAVESAATNRVDDPLFTALAEHLDARIVRLDEGFGQAARTSGGADDDLVNWSDDEEERDV
jgi:hypothetical protein